MFRNAKHNKTTLWEVEVELDIPAGHSSEDHWPHTEPRNELKTHVFTARTARAAATWVAETFLTQWPNDVKIRRWRLSVFSPYDVDTRNGAGIFTIFDNRDHPVGLAQACRDFDAQ